MVREKKRFENVLDDAVAAGMNAGTEVLMNQVSSRYFTRRFAHEVNHLYARWSTLY